MSTKSEPEGQAGAGLLCGRSPGKANTFAEAAVTRGHLSLVFSPHPSLHPRLPTVPQTRRWTWVLPGAFEQGPPQALTPNALLQTPVQLTPSLRSLHR